MGAVVLTSYLLLLLKTYGVFRRSYNVGNCLETCISSGMTPPAARSVRIQCCSCCSKTRCARGLKRPSCFRIGGRFLDQVTANRCGFLTCDLFGGGIEGTRRLSTVRVCTSAMGSMGCNVPVVTGSRGLICASSDRKDVLPRSALGEMFGLHPLIRGVIVGVALGKLSRARRVASLRTVLSKIVAKHGVCAGRPVTSCTKLMFPFSPARISGEFASGTFIFKISGTVPGVLGVRYLNRAFGRCSRISLSSILGSFAISNVIVSLIIRVKRGVLFSGVCVRG